VSCSWWAHSKPYHSSLGHQLHFDTEERTLSATGEVLHPAVTTVTYLSEGGCVSGAAASSTDQKPCLASPTVVFEQALSDCTARSAGAPAAHVVHPVEGTTLFYPGEWLHGVCPSPAPPASTNSARQCPTKISEPAGLPACSQSRGKRHRRGNPEANGPAALTQGSNEDECGTKPRDRTCEETAGAEPGSAVDEEAVPPRITLMISFWRRPIGAGDFPASVRRATSTGVCAAIPRSSRSCTWPRSLEVVKAVEATGAPWPQPRCLAVPAVADPWQKLPVGSASEDCWRGLTVPEERDTHFFLHSMADLQGCYGNE